ncbi:MAG TPA: alanine racemase [Trinickia sp.]|jgi:diaminopimelate decarboxylase|nr:alanine racemase [Trinickia sp.]
MVNNAPTLPALWDPALRRFADERTELIRELVRAFDAPLHFVFAQQFERNVRAFEQVLKAHGVDGQVFFAKKANKARCFAQTCAALRAGVDVASAGEFAEALAAGVRGEHIGVSGPAKAQGLIGLALAHGALIAIDSLDELARTVAVARQTGRTARVLLRMRPADQRTSRFGLDQDALEAALAQCAREAPSLRFEGISFHLSGYRADARAHEAVRALSACAAARARGLKPRTIDIGGGFAVSYASERDWRAFVATHGPCDYHADKTFESFYPYHQTPHGAAMLDAMLGTVPEGASRPLARLVADEDLRIMLEPGRALVDQAGFTVFAVQGVKDVTDEAGRSYGIVTVNGTSFSVSEQWFGSEFLLDPELLPAVASAPSLAAPCARYRACVGGASCLDADMLTWRKVAFSRRPAAGDLLLYPNTAGYQMDSNESPFHALPLPPKIAVTLDEAHTRAHWRLDGPTLFSGA